MTEADRMTGLKPEWEMLPHLGIGAIRFGMARDEAVAVGAIFGPVTHEHAQEEDHLFATLAPTMGEDEARAFIASMVADGIDTRPQRQIVFSDVLQMHFFGNELTSITALPRAHDLHVVGVPFFRISPVPALHRLQAMNGAPPLMHERSCLFDALNVATWDLAVISKKAGLGLATSMIGHGLERTVSWGAVSPVSKDVVLKYTRVDLEPIAESAQD
jgi:hypothetical protein